MAHDGRAQLTAAIDQRGCRRQVHRRMRPQPAHPSHQVTQDRCQIEPTKQGERNDVIDDQELVETALALSPGMASAQQVAHQLRRTQLLEHLKTQRMTKLAVIIQLLYPQTHTKFLHSFTTTIHLALSY